MISRPERTEVRMLISVVINCLWLLAAVSKLKWMMVKVKERLS